jgi:hypothetical protein
MYSERGMHKEALWAEADAMTVTNGASETERENLSGE